MQRRGDRTSRIKDSGDQPPQTSTPKPLRPNQISGSAHFQYPEGTPMGQVQQAAQAVLRGDGSRSIPPNQSSDQRGNPRQSSDSYRSSPSVYSQDSYRSSPSAYSQDSYRSSPSVHSQ